MTLPAIAGSRRIAPLDGMRALAVAAVIATHALPRRFPGGIVGVDVFFVISGFVITSLLLRERASTGRIDLRAFYFRRFLRLVPALAAFVVGASVLGAALGYPHPLADAVAALTFTSNAYYNVVGEHANTVGHTWSLAVEEQFYLLWPPLVAWLLARGRGLWGVIVVAVASMPVLNAVLLKAGFSVDVLYRLPHTRLPELLAGAAAAVLVARSDRVPWLARWARNPVVPWLVALGLTVSVRYPLYADKYRFVVLFAVIGAGVGWLILHLVHAPTGLMARALSWRPLVHVGLISYAVYLWHWPALVIGNELEIGRWRFLVAIPLTFLLAELSWWLVEQPANRYKDRRYARAARSTPNVAEAVC